LDYIRTVSKKMSEIPKRRTKLRPKVPCHCKKCNGKHVDTRTRKRHEEEEKRFQSFISTSPESSNRLRSNSVDSSQILHDDDVVMDEDRSDEEFLTPGPVSIRRNRRRFDKFQNTRDHTMAILDEETEHQVSSSDDDESSVDDASDSEGEESVSDDGEVPIEPFATPGSYDQDYEDPITNTNVNDLWVLLWIFKYQERFRLSDVAINALIGFFSLVLKDVDLNRFENFPSTAYMARKVLDIKKRSITFASCTDCNKLYNTDEIIPKDSMNTDFTGFKCTNVEFPNHPIQSRRGPCGSELLTKVPANNRYIWRPKMVFPLPCIKTQLAAMYNRPGFEELLRKWTNRDVATDIMSDIYDGNIWKEFPSSTDAQSTSKFFTPETADSNLGIMINLDWFQPFDSSVYSSGAIYGVICNLPRDVRFKRENVMTLGLLPGPNEVKLDRINHFLAPIIDELLELWNGFSLPKSDKHPTGKHIRVAVICCSNDIPAARKLCGHISALVGCHRCYKRASGDEGQRLNFGGFDDIEEWFIPKDVTEHRRNAMVWKHQLTKTDRKNHVSRTHVRWSEMLRLPYFDPIRFLVVDPMHNLFLGIAHWIVKRLWVEGGKITKPNLELMEKRAKRIKMPADLGRIPYKIATGDGFSGYTADQWKSFIMIYAIPLMWDILDDNDRKILANFVRVCVILTTRIIEIDALDEAHSRLLNVAQLVEENYGPEMITPNIHLSLHLTECCLDYGPIYSFWCYSFERMNGLLGKLYADFC
jgi:hypothetical protein